MQLETAVIHSLLFLFSKKISVTFPPNMMLRRRFINTHFFKIAFMFCLLPLSFTIESNVQNSQDDFNPDSRIEKQEQLNSFSSTTENVVRYNRQLDVEVENRFHINANTIIRTGESKILGAKYLNETVLPTNHDCLIWCLETPNCNAVVFEEKMLRSCYMFNCGSPTSFLCKFTKHDFFTSSVLKVTQHSYELSQWGNQVKHEKELAELKTTDNHYTSSPSPPPPPVPGQKIVPVTSAVPHSSNNFTKPVNKCHHYQFQCVNNSECIAIYNVCDGIPQCSDESDESPDLKCHMKDTKETVHISQKPVEPPQPPENQAPHSITEIKTPSSTAIHNSQNMHPEQPMDKQNPQQIKSGSRHTEKPKSIWPDSRISDSRVSNADYYHRPEESDGLGSPFIHKHSQFVAANDAPVQGRNHWPNDYDQYPPHSVSLEQQYNPYDGNYQRVDDQYLPNPMSPEYDGVKGYGNYRQEEVPYWPNQDSAQDGTYPIDEFPQSGMHGLNKQSNYPDKESLYAQQLSRTAGQYPEAKHHIIHKPMDISTVQKNRASDIEEYKSRRFPLQRQQPYMAYEEALQKQLAGYADQKPKHYESSHNIEDSMYNNNNDDLIRASLVNQLPMELERSHPYQYEKHVEETETPPDPKQSKDGGSTEKETKKVLPKDDSLIVVKPTTHPKPVQKTVLDFKMSVTELYQASRTHTQEANSAILALVMGLTITFLLFVFLSCRVKTIRKRMSRKGRALAHDADYLVNGMYL